MRCPAFLYVAGPPHMVYSLHYKQYGKEENMHLDGKVNPRSAARLVKKQGHNITVTTKDGRLWAKATDEAGESVRITRNDKGTMTVTYLDKDQGVYLSEEYGTNDENELKELERSLVEWAKLA